MKHTIGALCLALSALCVYGACPFGGMMFNNQYCFYGSRGPATFCDAYRGCTSLKSDCLLVELDSSNEAAGSKHDYLLQYITNVSYTQVFWVGAMDILQEDLWVRAGTGLAALPFTFQSGEHAGTSSKNCLTARPSDLKAKDESCSKKRHYMCECTV